MNARVLSSGSTPNHSGFSTGHCQDSGASTGASTPRTSHSSRPPSPKGYDADLGEDQAHSTRAFDPDQVTATLTNWLEGGGQAKRAIEGIVEAFGGTSEKGRAVLAKSKALARARSTKEAKDRGKEFGNSVKALVKDKVVKRGLIVVGLSTVGIVLLAVLCAAATYPILRAAIANGTATGNRKTLAAPGATPLVYALPPAYKPATKNSSNSNSQYG
jgi:hypothetical protein